MRSAGLLAAVGAVASVGLGVRGNSCNAPVPTSPSQVFHFLKVAVDATNVTVSPTDESGNTFDVQTYPLN